MDFADTAEQADLRSAVRAFARRHATPAQVRAVMSGLAGYDAAVWERLTTELGLTALAVPDSFGGVGAGAGEVAVAVEELGRVLLPSPYLSSAVVALALAAARAECPDAASRYLPGLADGSVIGALALDTDVTLADVPLAPATLADVPLAEGTLADAARAGDTGAGGTVTGFARNVVDGAAAGVLLVRAGDRLLAVSAGDAVVEAVETLDQTRRQAMVRFDHAPAVAVGPAAPAVALHRVLLAAECVAAAEHCLDVTVEYLKTRRQFGRPIGSFQALQHRAADLAVAVCSARATGRAAVRTAVANPARLATLAPLAALYCSRTFLQVAGEMIQLHGGMGFTWEHEAHLYFKRAKSTQLLLGPVSALRAEIGREAGLLSASQSGR